MTREELAAIRARAEASADAYFDHLAPRCSYTSAGDGMHCGLSSGHFGPHVMLVPANDGWRYVNEARQDVPRLCDEVARLAAEVERLRFDYERGHAAGDAARMQRCKQDVARALRLDGVSPPVWGDLVAEVEQLNADHAAVLADMGDALAEIGRLSAMVPRWVFATPSLGDLMVGGCRIGSVLRVGPRDWNGWVTDVSGTAWSYIGWEQTVEAACAAGCAQLGLPYIAPPETT